MSAIEALKVREFLKTVEDPEFEIDIVNLGLVYDIQVDGKKATVLMTLTSMGCPTAPLIEDRVKKAAKLVDGIEEAEVEWTFDPPWDPEFITEEGRDILESLGYL
ncbi:MAG TPA: metal-sulfur cluster assembly factor [Candidatus Glassbacteria bacterium]|nr:metal-sulfur cluster assembly factor [Candidatus Glassbacteria bacterium]